MSTSNKNILSVRDHRVTRWREQRYLYSYRQRQIGRSDCDIIANCGTIVLMNSFCNHSMLQNISLSQLNLCWNIRTLPCSSDGVRWFSLVSDEFRGVPMNSTEFRWAPIALYSQNASLFVSDWTVRGINEIIWVMFAIVDKPPIQDTWQNFKLSWCHGNRHYRLKTKCFLYLIHILFSPIFSSLGAWLSMHRLLHFDRANNLHCIVRIRKTRFKS